MSAPPGGLVDRGRGRALHVEPSGRLLAARGHELWATDDDGVSWVRVARVPAPRRAVLALTAPLARLLRQEVRAAIPTTSGRIVAATRKGLFAGPAGGGRLEPSRLPSVPGLRPPLTLASGPGGRVAGGEYHANRERREVHLLVSEDEGRSFEVAHTLPAGSVRHVHALQADAAGRGWWLLVGDHAAEPGIGWLSADLSDLRWVARGSQRHRAVAVIERGGELVYGTDSEVEPNHVVALEVATGRVREIQPLPGSCLHACRFGGLLALSTTVEPSKVNRSRRATLWTSRDGETWRLALSAAKDRWPARAFQYGSLVLPRGASDREVVALSGRGVVGLDDRLLCGALEA